MKHGKIPQFKTLPRTALDAIFISIGGGIKGISLQRLPGPDSFAVSKPYFPCSEYIIGEEKKKATVNPFPIQSKSVKECVKGPQTALHIAKSTSSQKLKAL